MKLLYISVHSICLMSMVSAVDVATMGGASTMNSPGESVTIKFGAHPKANNSAAPMIAVPNKHTVTPTVSAVSVPQPPLAQSKGSASSAVVIESVAPSAASPQSNSAKRVDDKIKRLSATIDELTNASITEKISPTLIEQHRKYRDAFVELQRRLALDSNLNVDAEIRKITDQYNLFATSFR